MGQVLSKMNLTSNNITDYFIEMLDEEYDSHIEDKDIDGWWSNFCRPDTEKDVSPDWDDMCIQDYIEQFFTEAFNKIPRRFKEAIRFDIDIPHLREWIKDRHRIWYEEKMEKDLETVKKLYANFKEKTSYDKLKTRKVLVRVERPEDSVFIQLSDPVCVMTIQECLERLVIVGCTLVFKKDLEKIHKKFGTCVYNEEEANLYNLMNYEFIEDADQDLWNYFKTVRDLIKLK